MGDNFANNYERLIGLLKQLGFEKIKQFNYENVSPITFTSAQGKVYFQNWYEAAREDYYRMGGFIFGIEVYEKHRSLKAGETEEKHVFEGTEDINQVCFLAKIENTKENRALFMPEDLNLRGIFPSNEQEYFYMDISLSPHSFGKFEKYLKDLISIHIQDYDFEDNESTVWCEYSRKKLGTTNFITIRRLLELQSTANLEMPY